MFRKSVLSAVALAASGLVSFFVGPVNATEIKLLSSVGLKSVIELVLPDFERTSGHKVTALYGTAAGLKKRIDEGELFDVAVLVPAQIDDLIKQGKAASATRADLARAGTGLGIRAGTPKPDISSDEKLKAFLLGVKSISHGDPALGGFGAVYFVKMSNTLGIAEALKAKTTYSKPGEGAVLVAKGEVELGVGMLSEVVPVAGVQALAYKVDDPASFIIFTGAIAAGTKDVDAAHALLTFMQSPTAKDVIKTQGMIAP
jgi:molybdate transport system substrate-binding protein